MAEIYLVQNEKKKDLLQVMYQDKIVNASTTLLGNIIIRKRRLQSNNLFNYTETTCIKYLNQDQIVIRGDDSTFVH